MRIAELEQLGELLEERVHLLVWMKSDGFEVVAVRGDDWEDAFPLPTAVQAAAAAAEIILDLGMAARLEIEEMPGDFWDGLEAMEYGSNLEVSLLGRPGAKYLEVYRAVRSGGDHEAGTLSDEERMKVARWIRESSFFDHRSGDALMEILMKSGR